MKSETEKKAAAGKTGGTGEHRRGFLKMVGLGAVGGGVAAVTGDTPAAAAEAKAEAEGTYRETEHVRTYYDLARF